MIDYSDIFRSQAESLNTADMEGILRAADAPGGGAEFQREGNRAEHVVGRRRGQSGESTGSAENHVFRRNPGVGQSGGAADLYLYRRRNSQQFRFRVRQRYGVGDVLRHLFFYGGGNLSDGIL